MGYREDMERCRLTLLTEAQPPSVQALAAQYGYSYFHFCHVFKSVNGVSPGAFLRARRLHNAALALQAGKSVTDAAMDNGFDTVSGFTRAFRQVFGRTPSDYQKTKEVITMIVPTFEKKDAFCAVGYVLRPEEDVDTQTQGAFWLGKDFSAVSPETYASLCAPGYAEIGAWVQPEADADELYYFLGPSVMGEVAVPQGMRLLKFPAAEYAVFDVPAGETPQQLSENVSAVWRFIFKDWFDASSYVFDRSARDFEWYCGNETKIFVPVVKKK